MLRPENVNKNETKFVVCRNTFQIQKFGLSSSQEWSREKIERINPAFDRCQMHKKWFNIGTNFLLIFCGLLFKLFGNIYWFRVFLLFLHWPLIIMNKRSFFQVNKITNDSVQNKQAYKNNFCCLMKQKFILKNTIYCRYVNQVNFASVAALNKNAG